MSIQPAPLPKNGNDPTTPTTVMKQLFLDRTIQTSTHNGTVHPFIPSFNHPVYETVSIANDNARLETATAFPKEQERFVAGPLQFRHGTEVVCYSCEIHNPAGHVFEHSESADRRPPSTDLVRTWHTNGERALQSNNDLLLLVLSRDGIQERWLVDEKSGRYVKLWMDGGPEVEKQAEVGPIGERSTWME